MTSLRRLLVLAGVLVAVALLTRGSRRDHRADPREGERRDHHEDGPRSRARSRSCASAGQLLDRRGAEEGARRDHAAAPRRHDRRDAAAPAGQGARATSCRDEQFKRDRSRTSRRRTRSRPRSSSQAALKQEGLTMADLRKLMERSCLISQVQQSEVVGRISITEAEAKAYYERAHLRVHHAGRADAARDPGGGAERRQDAQRRPRRGGQGQGGRGRARAVAGESFEKLVGRGVRSAVEGQRRPHRPDQRGRTGRRRCARSSPA